MIGKIERIPLREVWRHEAKDLSVWLQENIDVLNEIIDMNLSNPEREQSAGKFNVDLIAEDESGNPVIIENQLEKSDHDHLGKLVTYLTAVDAKAAIWIVKDPRPEHINAISWLNESSSANFYLIKLEAIKIGNSSPAPLLTLIVGPSEESKEVGKTKKDLAERYIIRRRFWTALLELAKQKNKLHANISPSKDNWIGAGAGKGGLTFNYVIRQHDTQVELYINRGKDNIDENKKIFDLLEKNKKVIETEFGSSLIWERLEGKSTCRIRSIITEGGYRDEDKWPKIHEKMVDAMSRLAKAFKAYIRKLKI